MLVKIDQTVENRPQRHDKDPIHGASLQTDLAVLGVSPCRAFNQTTSSQMSAPNTCSAVKTDKGVEQAAINAARDGQTEMNQMHPFVALNHKKRRAQATRSLTANASSSRDRSRALAWSANLMVTALASRIIVLMPVTPIGKTRLKRRRPDRAADAKNQKRADQTGKKHRLGAEKHQPCRARRWCRSAYWAVPAAAADRRRRSSARFTSVERAALRQLCARLSSSP